MSDHEDMDDFNQGDSGATGTYPVQAGAIKKGGFCMLKGFPCKVVDYSTAKVGKHGSAKAKIIGTDIFTGQKYEEVCPTSHNMNAPDVKRESYSLIDVSDDGFVTLLSDGSADTREDIMLPKTEVGERIKTLFAEEKSIVVTVQGAVGIEMIIEAKESNS